MRFKAARVEVLRRYRDYLYAVSSLNSESLAAYKSAAQRVGPAFSSPAFIGSATGDGVVVGALLSALVNATAGLMGVRNVGAK